MRLQVLKTALLATVVGMISVGCSSTQPHSEQKSQKISHKNNAPIQTIAVNAVSAQGIDAKIGTISFQDSPQGLVITPKLSELPSGFHGFHIHEKGSCAPAEKDGKLGAALAAGGHFNPHQAAGHGTPNEGHLGDLPVLNVDSTGEAKTAVVAPRLKLADIQGLAIMVHAGGDNYADHPKPLGGGGDRIACGVIR